MAFASIVGGDECLLCKFEVQAWFALAITSRHLKMDVSFPISSIPV